ncbi:hypothetical protein ZOSMA_105G00050 [Zostera marina]|uniref:Uncharacterized protein n=1 Tax=Zostera marina TaxID=29655 RepID=A0A0K9Q4I7_ZOSMR|nr:hypothetical protein ZOSMA_105G00050 [Zostera marina]
MIHIWFLLYISLFMVAYTRDMVDFLRSDHGSFSKWWNDQRMWLIRGVTSYPLGITEALIKQMGFHNIGFEVTSKVTEKDANNRYKKGIFDFGVESVFMISLGLFALMSLVAFIVGFSRILLMADTRFEESALPLLLCGFVIVNCWPIYEAMTFRKDSGSIPTYYNNHSHVHLFRSFSLVFVSPLSLSNISLARLCLSLFLLASIRFALRYSTRLSFFNAFLHPSSNHVRSSTSFSSNFSVGYVRLSR